MDGIDPTRRLMFWFKAPFIADVVIAVVGVGLLLAARPVGWWVLLFAVIRAIVGAIFLWLVAPRMIAQRTTAEPPDEP